MSSSSSSKEELATDPIKVEPILAASISAVQSFALVPCVDPSTAAAKSEVFSNPEMVETIEQSTYILSSGRTSSIKKQSTEKKESSI